MKQLATSAALALALSAGAAGLAHASTYVLDVDGCSSGCGYSSYGTVTVTGEGTDVLNFTVSLDPNVYFNQAGKGHDAFYFDLTGSPTVSISGLPSTFTANGNQSAGSHGASGFGSFSYAIDWKGPPTNNSHLGVQTLSFTVTGSKPLTLGHVSAYDKFIYFATDVAAVKNKTTKTGLVGAEKEDDGGGGGDGVPEPATWTAMVLGFGGLGSVLRRKRAAGALA